MDDEKLINLVQTNKCIYDKTCADFRNKMKKAAAWQNIAQEMEASEKQCMRRWTSLRDKYTKVCREQEQASGSGANDGSNSWHLHESMGFLKTHVKPRLSRNNVLSEILCPFSPMSSEQEVDIDLLNIGEQSKSTIISPTASRKRRNSEDDALEKCTISGLGTCEKKCKVLEQNSSENAVIEGFKTMIGGLIAQMPPPKQILVMKKILDLICDENKE